MCHHPSHLLLRGYPKQVWYVDGAEAVRKIRDLQDWLDHLITENPSFGYFPNSSKTWLVTKDGSHINAISTFSGTEVNVTSDGRPYLGVALGSQNSVEKHVESKVN